MWTLFDTFATKDTLTRNTICKAVSDTVTALSRKLAG